MSDNHSLIRLIGEAIDPEAAQRIVGVASSNVHVHRVGRATYDSSVLALVSRSYNSNSGPAEPMGLQEIFPLLACLTACRLVLGPAGSPIAVR